ncbi:MAG: efflux RND transporter periplasmic adaptor subunit [Candidatus Alcyoniella australis]|nr:efflux RND transporter periplasmic adaptor subunit [Candidatus Alcyoniella australis]
MKRLIPLILVLALAGYFGYRSWERAREAETNDLYYGTVEADEVLVSSMVPGQILELYAEEGRGVDQGQTLIVLDDKLLRAQLAQGNATVQATGSQVGVVNAGLRGVNTEVQRVRKLVESGSATQMQLDALEAQRDTLLAQRRAVGSQVSATTAAVEVIQTQLSYTTIEAPISGTVLRLHVDRGETVFTGSSLMALADLSKMKINVYVPEPLLGKIKLGERVEVFNDSQPDQPLYGSVARIADSAEFTPKNVQTRDERVRLVYKVRIEIDNPGGVLKIGMPVDVRFLGE